MLVTREDPGNASTSLSNPTSTPSYATSIVGGETLVAPSTALGSATKHVSNCSVENMGAVCGVRGVVWSLGTTLP